MAVTLQTRNKATGMSNMLIKPCIIADMTNVLVITVYCAFVIRSGIQGAFGAFLNLKNCVNIKLISYLKSEPPAPSTPLSSYLYYVLLQNYMLPPILSIISHTSLLDNLIAISPKSILKKRV